MKKVDCFVKLVANPKFGKRVLSMFCKGYLYEIGWINSLLNQMPVEKDGSPLPWVTYPYMDFISARLDKNMHIFEYGSGNSTYWYAKRVKSVVSIEHDMVWYKKFIDRAIPHNVNIYYKELEYGGEYASYVVNIGKRFDIVIVDGRDRVNCIKSAVNVLSEMGVVVLDDSERGKYKEGIEYLERYGFKRIDFWGISPGLFYKKCTSIFYKNDNCLGI